MQTLSICEPFAASESEVTNPDMLRALILGDQAPRLVVSNRRQADAWRDVRADNLREKLNDQLRICLFITPNGVLGYYNMLLVRAFIRDGLPWGRITDPTVVPQGEVVLPHLQISNGMTLGRYLELLRDKSVNDFMFNAEERTYMRTVGSVLPSVTSFMPPEVPVDDATCTNVSFYVSQAGTVTNLHWDAYSGVIHQLRGRKRVLLFAPDQKPKFSMYPNRHIFARRSSVCEKLTEATLSARPELQAARGWECIIEPDQWLYIPAGWLHHVETLDDDTLSIITRFSR